MAEVYNGQVLIPYDQLDNYFAVLKQAELEKAPFKEYMTDLSDEFIDHLEQNYSDRTVHRHAGTVTMFIEFLCRYTDVMNIREITRGIANTHFRRWYKRKVWDTATEQDLKVGLRKFFQFLDSKGIEFDQKILKGLGPSKLRYR